MLVPHIHSCGARPPSAGRALRKCRDGKHMTPDQRKKYHAVKRQMLSKGATEFAAHKIARASTRDPHQQQQQALDVRESVLERIKNEEPLSPISNLAREIGCSVGAVSRALKQLETEGLVHKIPHAKMPHYKLWAAK